MTETILAGCAITFVGTVAITTVVGCVYLNVEMIKSMLGRG